MKNYLIIGSRSLDPAYGLHTRRTLEEAQTVARNHVEADTSGSVYEIYELVKVGQMVREGRWKPESSPKSEGERTCESS